MKSDVMVWLAGDLKPPKSDRAASMSDDIIFRGGCNAFSLDRGFDYLRRRRDLLLGH
jgi:hypothetical protein